MLADFNICGATHLEGPEQDAGDDEGFVGDEGHVEVEAGEDYEHKDGMDVGENFVERSADGIDGGDYD